MGSESTLRFPVSAVAREGDVPAGHCGPAGAPGAQRVLVVDDNADSADSLGMMLRIMGYEVECAYDGETAVRAAETYAPHVMLLDIGMPHVSGYDVCRRIREQPWGRPIVIVALTGWGQEEDRRRSHDAGFDHHLVKPVEPEALEQLLGSLPPPGSGRDG